MSLPTKIISASAQTGHAISQSSKLHVNTWEAAKEL